MMITALRPDLLILLGEKNNMRVCEQFRQNCYMTGSGTDNISISSNALTITPSSHKGLTMHTDRSFAAAGPRLWNSLPVHLRDEDISYNSFQRELKTFWF